jgi:two-component system, chemotaxis family, protein-glutamate methylesterase/glutaminase
VTTSDPEQGREREDKRDPDRDVRHKRIRVLIVDDSALMRRLLSDLLSTAPEIEIAGTARNGREAVLEAVRLKPDVITLDVEMPEVSGLDALPTLLAVQDAPVIMVSALTQEGADVTLQALEMGAIDFLPKPERNQLAEMRANRDLLVAKVLGAVQGGSRRSRRPRTMPGAAKAAPLLESSGAPTAARATPRPRAKPVASGVLSLVSSRSQNTLCVVIGISTGGPQALSQVFPLLTPPLPPILVVQHMPAQFTKVFAQRLDRYTTLTVKQAEEGDAVLPSQVLIAPGGRHMALVGHPPRVRIALSDEPPVSSHRPSVDVLFRSAAAVYQSTALGLIMTGMGRDGVEGCKAILAAGGLALGQDEATSAVYGMNKAAMLEGAVKGQFPLEEFAEIFQSFAAVRSDLEASGLSDHEP